MSTEKFFTDREGFQSKGDDSTPAKPKRARFTVNKVEPVSKPFKSNSSFEERRFDEGQSYRKPGFSRPMRNNDETGSSFRPNQNFKSRFPRQGDNEESSERGFRPSFGDKKRFVKPIKKDYDPNAKYSKKKQIEYQDDFTDPTAPLRLNKFLANSGVCSRREADEFIKTGVVKVNGVVVSELGTKVQRTDTIHFHDQLVSIEKKVYVLLNKPKNCVTTTDDPQERRTVMDLVKGACNERIYPVGRLDSATTGVLLLTNDGDLAAKLTHPQFVKKKIYHVWLNNDVPLEHLQQIADGIDLEDGPIHADAISYVVEDDKKQVGIEIHSGRNRLVRRIFEHFGYRVVKLDRVMFAGLTKRNLKRGMWRYLTQSEVNILRMGAF